VNGGDGLLRSVVLQVRAGSTYNGSSAAATDAAATSAEERDMQDSTQQGTDETATVERTLPDLTPYAASKVVNTMLARAGVAVKVTSQAMYSRASKGVVESYRDADGKWFVKGESFARWAKRYVDGYVNGTATQTRVDYDALADLYAV
jgi:hypothetical protein